MHNTNEATTNELGRTKRSSAAAGKVGRGDLGAFLLKREVEIKEPGVWKRTTQEFSCGSGLTDAHRMLFWAQRDTLLGQRVKFKYLEHGSVDAPRHPVFIGLRDECDL